MMWKLKFFLDFEKEEKWLEEMAWKGYQLYGEVAESVGLTWGGRWKSINVYGHTEFRMPGLKKTAEMAEKLTTEGQLLAQELN